MIFKKVVLKAGLSLVLASASLALAVPGQAVYYGGKYNPHTRMTAAHRTLPFGSWVRVTLRNGHSVDVLINDRGPFGNSRRIIDLSRTAAARLGILSQGVAAVDVRVLKYGRR
ncbi:septal ring lytic transglycosylase RlpA family protein [Deinococcus psychrotolerans]|uniref:septal ring lytic transglycosylase RlpA family protein n=1 Tax=Deinococcus psychrotolerans TaxID=2489213 RepID=UPI002404C15A|nr:septal ring lytic transglycosylase RlpA family protein [Deinococcus psychrotolerans]